MNKLQINLSRSDSGRRNKINLNFYFDTSLWYPKRCLKGLNKRDTTDTTEKCQNKNLR